MMDPNEEHGAVGSMVDTPSTSKEVCDILMDIFHATLLKKDNNSDTLHQDNAQLCKKLNDIANVISPDAKKLITEQVLKQLSCTLQDTDINAQEWLRDAITTCLRAWSRSFGSDSDLNKAFAIAILYERASELSTIDNPELKANAATALGIISNLKAKGMFDEHLLMRSMFTSMINEHHKVAGNVQIDTLKQQLEDKLQQIVAAPSNDHDFVMVDAKYSDDLDVSIDSREDYTVLSSEQEKHSLPFRHKILYTLGNVGSKIAGKFTPHKLENKASAPSGGASIQSDCSPKNNAVPAALQQNEEQRPIPMREIGPLATVNEASLDVNQAQHGLALNSAIRLE